jgi:hypothetical protein
MVYFFKENSDFKTFGLINSLYNQFKDIFTTEPQSLPIPNDAPMDVPRCIWNDVNTNLTFNRNMLDFSFNIPTNADWHKKFTDFNKKISNGLLEQRISIDRVGLVSELIPLDDLHDVLKKYVSISQFNIAREANLSWLEYEDKYNIWTYFIINESQNENKVVFDINSLPENKLSKQEIFCKDAMDQCANILERRMKNVL